MATILVVDDELTMLNLCENILRMGGYEVLKASGGQEAFTVLQGNTADLVLLDVIMPGMNGIEVAKRIQSMTPSTKIVLMTGYGPHEIARVAGSNNPYRIIWKPFKAESLLRMIENVLEEAASTTA